MNSPKSSEPSLEILLTHFKWTIERFEEILKNEKTDYYRDAALQRFSFTCEMALKCIRFQANGQGGSCENFEQCLQWIEEKNWLDDNTPWNEVLESYRLASEKQPGESADLEYEKLETHCVVLKNIYKNLEIN